MPFPAFVLLLAGVPAASTAVPAEFDHDRVIVTPRVDGQILRFFTDTGGGFNALAERAVARLGLTVEEVEADGQAMKLVPFPTFDAGAAIPKLLGDFMGGRLAVAPDKDMWSDGFLGGRWFADRIWDIDYPAQQLSLLDERGTDVGECTSLGFQVGDDGKRTMHFPSIDVVIDGETLPMLLDTGATATTTASSAPVFGVKAGERVGTSFIEAGVFKRWVEKHPDWRVVDEADAVQGQRLRMIEVPSVSLAGAATGPVWFAERGSGAFQKYMASMMDRPTWGAIGGSAFRYVRMVIDYPGAAACFSRPPISRAPRTGSR